MESPQPGIRAAQLPRFAPHGLRKAKERKRPVKRFSKGLLALAAALVISPTALADGFVIYNNISNPLPPNVPSEPYEAVQSGEFGGLIQFAGGGSSYSLASATVAMSDWALASTYTSSINNSLITIANSGYSATSSGFYVPLTLNLYNVGASNSVGSLFATETVDAFIPWRPEADGSCGSGYSSGGACYNGSLSTVTFNLAGVGSPGQIIYSLAFNTTDYGASPTGVAGPYDSLNLGLSVTSPSVGSNPLPGTAYWETSTAGWYADGGAGGVGTLRQDTGWTPYSGEIEFTSTPEPSSLLLLSTGLLGLAGIVFRKTRTSDLVLHS